MRKLIKTYQGEKSLEQIDKDFTECLWEMKDHWFTDVHNTIRVQSPICYALYQTFCIKYNYKFGEFDLIPAIDRVIFHFWEDKTKKKKGLKTYFPRIGFHPGDYQILRPIFFREKEKYLEMLKNQ